MPDILIRGMEMPEDGHVIVRIYANGDVCKPTTCPCVLEKVARADSLPEGHGRLIDADDALKKIPIPTGGVSSVDIYNNIEYFIETRPTIVPAGGGTDDG